MNSFDAGYQPEPPAYTNSPAELNAARIIVDAFLGADPLKGEVLAMIFGNN